MNNAAHILVMQNRRFPTTGSLSRAPKFKVVVAFDDNMASASAMKTCEYVISQLGDEIQVRRKVVDFNHPTDARKLAAAAKDAASADMVIVSTGESARLPSTMQAWMDSWSGKRSADEGALVAILKPSGEVRDQLASVARQAHMDFFSSEMAGA